MLFPTPRGPKTAKTPLPGENAFNNYVNRRISGPLFLGFWRPGRLRQAAQAALPLYRAPALAALPLYRAPALPRAPPAPAGGARGRQNPKKQGSRDPSIYIVIKSIFPFWGSRTPPEPRRPSGAEAVPRRRLARRGPGRPTALGRPLPLIAPLDYS